MHEAQLTQIYSIGTTAHTCARARARTHAHTHVVLYLPCITISAQSRINEYALLILASKSDNFTDRRQLLSQNQAGKHQVGQH